MALLYGALAYMVGIAIGRAVWDGGGFGCEFPIWLWLAPLALVPFTPWLSALEKPPLARVPLRWPTSAGFEVPRTGPSLPRVVALILCLMAGVLRYASHPYTPCWTPTDLAFYNQPAGQAFDRAAPQVTLVGYLSSYPLVADVKQKVKVTATRIVVGDMDRPVQGDALITTGIDRRYAYGQPVRIRARLVTPPELEDFSFREYLARRDIHSLLYSAHLEPLDGLPQGNPLLRLLYAGRARGEALINRTLPDPYAALANGMLLGIEAGIPAGLYEQFNATGSSHVIVISG